MTIRADLLTAARNILIGATDATDGKVINAGAKGVRPAKPYVTVRVTSPGGSLLHGPAERIDGINGSDNPQATMQERREASISFQAYGPTALQWLDQMEIRIDAPATLALQSTNNVAALLLSPVTDLSALLDTSEEQRGSLELKLRYLYADDPVEQVELARVEVTATLERFDGDPDTLDADFAVDGDGDMTTPP